MRTIELSNHPAKQRQSVLDERAAAAAKAQTEYEAELAEYTRRRESVKAERQQAHSEGRWLRWLGRVFAGLFEQAQPRPSQVQTNTFHEEAKLTAGMEGELLVANHLDLVLGDEWMLLRGYKNRRGEIDGILIGPQGVIAIEVKHYNATASCAGDEWWFDKYDRKGKHVGYDRRTDRAGRSPSRQLNVAANALQEFLGRRGKQVAIRRVVLLTHERSRLGETSDVTVDLISTSTSGVLTYLITDKPVILSEADRKALEGLVVRDHQFHETKRPHRRASNDKRQTSQQGSRSGQ